MGLYDSVFIRCPQCGSKLEFQSKAGPCCLFKYQLHNAPPSILDDLDGDYKRCPNCNENVYIHTVTIANVSMGGCSQNWDE